VSEVEVAALGDTLREAHETYRHLVEGIPAVLYVDANDERSTNIYTSPQIEPLLGFTVERWRDDPDLWLDHVHDEDRERVIGEHRESLGTGEPFRTEYRFRTADDRLVWLRDEAVLVRDDDGRPSFWRGFIIDITQTKRAEEGLRRSGSALRRTMQERRRLLLRLEDARQEERRRIASDIHDDPIQVMSAADMRVQALAQRLDDPDLRSEAEELRGVIHSAVERLRHLLFELRPPSLDREGLAAALHAWAGDAEPAPSIEDRLTAEPPRETQVIVFRIAQEAIANARKHAGANRIEVSIAEEDGGVRLVVSDDGSGFDPGVVVVPEPGHIGLPTMLERAELAGGHCEIESDPGRGTSVRAWLPLASAAADA
jgi:PAS domain S-box-containing protein